MIIKIRVSGGSLFFLKMIKIFHKKGVLAKVYTSVTASVTYISIFREGLDNNLQEVLNIMPNVKYGINFLFVYMKLIIIFLLPLNFSTPSNYTAL